MIYIVNVSTGLSSTEALERTIERYGRESTVAIFADVKGHNNLPHTGEDVDSYRFLDATAAWFGIEVVRLVEGRDIWQVMFDERAITLPVGKTRVAKCSIKLKREPIDQWVKKHYSPDTCVRVTGLGWNEPNRVADYDAVVAPYHTWHPMVEPPFVDNCAIADKWRGRAIEPPKLYEDGFDHGNCGGFCVKAGQGHFARLYFTNRERYFYHAERERLFIETINPKATILRDRRGGTTKPMTLYEFAERLERGEAYDKDDLGGCGCFAPVRQERMIEVLF